MMYKFTIIKSDETSNSDFESAFNCSVQSVRSVLEEYNLEPTIDSPSIYISESCRAGGNTAFISVSQCGVLIEGSFKDSSNRLYPEFASMTKEEVIESHLAEK
jgi:hypothetical protein